MKRVEEITFQAYFAQVGGSSVCSVLIAYALMTVRIFSRDFYFFFAYAHYKTDIYSSKKKPQFIRFCLLQLDYLPFYGVMIFLLIQIFVPCLLGNFVEITVCITIHLNHLFQFESCAQLHILWRPTHAINVEVFFKVDLWCFFNQNTNVVRIYADVALIFHQYIGVNQNFSPIHLYAIHICELVEKHGKFSLKNTLAFSPHVGFQSRWISIIYFIYSILKSTYKDDCSVLVESRIHIV